MLMRDGWASRHSLEMGRSLQACISMEILVPCIDLLSLPFIWH